MANGAVKKAMIVRGTAMRVSSGTSRRTSGPMASAVRAYNRLFMVTAQPYGENVSILVRYPGSEAVLFHRKSSDEAVVERPPDDRRAGPGRFCQGKHEMIESHRTIARRQRDARPTALFVEPRMV